MRRIEPAFPDLLPISFQLGSAPADSAFEPIEMRLRPSAALSQAREGDRSILRRPARLAVHAAVARAEREHVGRLVDRGYGLLVFLDDTCAPIDLPPPGFAAQIVVAARASLPMWGAAGTCDLGPWVEAGYPAGVLLGLGPCHEPFEPVAAAASRAHRAGASFLVAAPLMLTPEDRHRAYEAAAGEQGDGVLEDLLFHTDLGVLMTEIERETTRCCLRLGLAEVLPGPSTSRDTSGGFASGAELLLWARRLDLLDGVDSSGWQLRRAAHALLASGRDPGQLVVEDNLRIVPGFNPWVEAFARSLWSRGGPPFDEYLERWIAR